jgi:RNA polymerase sigma factor (sigma-70 family)
MFLQSRRKRFSQLADKELIDLYVTDRCEHTLPILYERYGHLVMGSCMNYLRQVENAEDVTMRIFGELGAKLLRHEVQHFKSWLFQVTRNECLQFLRKHKPGEMVVIGELAQPVDESDFDGEKLEVRLQLLEQAIEELKGDQKICIRLFYIDQRSYAEIAESTDLPLNAVKSAIQNGKRNLKIWMERKERYEG